MSETNGFSGWERMEAMDLLPLEEKATPEHCKEIAALGRAICFDSDNYLVGTASGPIRAVRFIDEDRHVTVVANDNRAFCDLDITIDQRDREGGDLVVRKVFEVLNSAWLLKRAAKITVYPSVKFMIEDEVIDVNKELPIDKPSRLYSWRARADYDALKGRSVTSNEFTIYDYYDLKSGLVAYGSMKRVFACGKEATRAL